MAADALYYERDIDDRLLSVLHPGGALDWLPAFLRGAGGTLGLADLQLRKDRQARCEGCLQVYVGSTSILEVLPWRRRSSVENRLRTTRYVLTVAGKTYRREWGGDMPPRGRPVDSELVRAAADAVRAYLLRASGVIGKRWLDDESLAHGGFMRRYGLCATSGSPIVALDREVVIGHRADRLRREARAKLLAGGYENNGRVSNELDALAILEDGSLGLVELKASVGGIRDAAAQVATYLDRFSRLRAQGAGRIPGVARLLEQKLQAGLVPPTGATKTFSPAAPLRPVIAIPDAATSWKERWTDALVQSGRRHQLRDVLLWRLSHDGTVLDEAAPFSA